MHILITITHLQFAVRPSHTRERPIYLGIAEEPRTVRNLVIVGDRRLAVGFELLFVSGILITGIRHHLQPIAPAVAQLALDTLDIDTCHILILHHALHLGENSPNIIIHIPEEAVHFIIEPMLACQREGSIQSGIHIVAVFRLQPYVGIDRCTVPQQLACQRQTHTMFKGGLESQLRQPFKTGTETITHIIFRRRSRHSLRTGNPVLILLLQLQMVEIVFHKEGVFEPSLQQRLVVREADDMFGQHIL